MPHSADVVAWQYNADEYCPGCIADMFAWDAGYLGGRPRYYEAKDILPRAAANLGIDYENEMDTEQFPQPVFLDQANDGGNWTHCGKLPNCPYDPHIAHEPDDCGRWLAFYNDYDREKDFARRAEWTDAREWLIEEIEAHARNVRSWSEPHNCDDIPCPTFGDECNWQLAGDVDLLAEELRDLAPGKPWFGSVGDMHYKLEESEDDPW